MKIAIVVPKQWYSHDKAKFSADLGCYMEAIVNLGHEPLIVCLEGSEYRVEYPVKAVPIYELRQEAFWKHLNLEAVLIFTWMRHADILRAMKAAGIFVVAKGDTEGRFSARVFPKYHFRRMLDATHTPWEKACALRHWLRRRQSLDEAPDMEAIDTLVIADKVSVDTHTAKRHLEQHLAFYGRLELASKITVLPPPLAEEFLTAPIGLARREKIVAIGRWDDPVKDAPLLEKTLAVYLQKRLETHVILIGAEGEKVFRPLSEYYPKVVITGVRPRSEIINELTDTRILLMTSQGESFHFASHEAMCLGATVVGPGGVIPLPDICREGPFGTEAAGRQPNQMAAALEAEMLAWECGQREPQAIAGFWRSRLSGTQIIRQIVERIPNAA